MSPAEKAQLLLSSLTVVELFLRACGELAAEPSTTIASLIDTTFETRIPWAAEASDVLVIVPGSP